MPAVSVIVLVYNAEGCIGRCARSLFGQTLEDVEYIVVDDCSTDASMEVLDRVLDGFPQRRSRVKVIRNDVNRGQAFSRRRGVESSTGDYIIHCDSDDWMEPGMLGRMYSKAKEEGLDMVMCPMLRVGMDCVWPMPDALCSDDLLESLLYLDIHHYLLNKMFPRNLYDPPFTWPECNMCEDIAIVMQLACRCRSWGFVGDVHYNYVYSPGGISSLDNTFGKVEQIRSNVALALACVEARYPDGRYKRAMMHLKGWVKISAFGLSRRYYLHLYPEANLPILTDRRFTPTERMGHLTKLLGIHGISRAFVKKRK